MDHSDVLPLLPAYLDQELSVVDALAVERHLAICFQCQRDIEEQRIVSKQTRAGGAYFRAPPALRAQCAAIVPVGQSPRTRMAMPRTAAQPVAAALALTLALTWGFDGYRAVTSTQQTLTEELVANHIRSLQVDHLTDVASSDQHTVKPWFLGKVTFAPPVVDLQLQGFPLVGGRMDYLANHDVAVLVYRRNRHPINLYVWPGANLPATPRTTHMQGYHLTRWSKDGMNFAVVSDVTEADLARFVQLLIG